MTIIHTMGSIECGTRGLNLGTALTFLDPTAATYWALTFMQLVLLSFAGVNNCNITRIRHTHDLGLVHLFRRKNRGAILGVVLMQRSRMD